MKEVEYILEELFNYIRLVKLGWLPEETLVQMIASVLDGEIDFPESLKLEVIEAYDKMERALRGISLMWIFTTDGIPASMFLC